MDTSLKVVASQATSPSAKPPILLIHGMFGGAWMWEHYQSMFARHGYTSHAVNLRGHHGSRPVPDIGTVSVNDYVDDALEVARALGNPIVIGHSMGGLIAQKVAEAGACRALVLIASAPPRWIPAVSRVLGMRLLKYLPKLVGHKPLLPKRRDADVLMFNRTPAADRDAQWARLVAESGKAGFELSLGVIGVSASRVTAPTLVVTGLDDLFVVPRIARSLARKYGATLKEYGSFAHHIITEPGWERPCGEVIEWLNARS